MGISILGATSCPKCRGRLTKKNSVRATLLVDGQRVPASWTYFVCQTCGSRWKRRADGPYEVVEDAEWTESAESGRRDT